VLSTPVDQSRVADSRGFFMDVRNRIGLYGSYFFGMAGIGFTLPYLPLYLGERGLSDGQIGLVSTLAALSALAQFPIGLWSDRLKWRKPFLVVALGVLALATVLLPNVRQPLLLGIVVVLFAENGICRALVESLSGAEAASLARPGHVGAALGALRFWRPVGIVAVALLGSVMAEHAGVASILVPVAIIQGLAFAASWLIHDENNLARQTPRIPAAKTTKPATGLRAIFRDSALATFVGAMVLFHLCNAPGGVYLGLYMTRELDAPARLLSYAFVISMVTWMLVARPVGWLADRWGRRPLMIICWGTMSLRLALVALARSPWEVVAVQLLDGLSGGLFAILAAAWVTDRLGDARRVSEAQVIVGTSLVFGSAVGPALSGLIVEVTGYRGLFVLLAGIGAMATGLVVVCLPETLGRPTLIVPLATAPDET
jgi:MFS family permease